MKRLFLFLIVTLLFCSALRAQELAYARYFEEYLSDEIGFFTKMISINISQTQNNGCIFTGLLSCSNGNGNAAIFGYPHAIMLSDEGEVQWQYSYFEEASNYYNENISYFRKSLYHQGINKWYGVIAKNDSILITRHFASGEMECKKA